MKEKPTEEIKAVAAIAEDQPGYQEKITFLVSTVAQAFILAWCLLVLSLGYIKLPTKLFGVEIPDQPRVDSTFAAGLLGNILGGLGISVNAANGNKKKKKEEQESTVNNSGGQQTLVIKQPIEIITRKPDVIRVDPITNRPVNDQGKLS